MTKARKSMLKITALLCLVFFVFSIVGPYGGMTVSAEPGTEPVNVALNKPVTSSDGTNITADHSPAKVVDGKTTHMDGWDSTSSSSMKAWVQIDLEDEFIITRVEYVDRTNFDWIGYRSNFQILASNDPNFETYVVLGGVGAEGFPDDTTWGVDVTDQTPYRYVRFQKTKVEYAYVVEIRVFGVPASEPEPEPEPENEIAFYVSPDGNDNNDGSINSPFATIEKARDTIRNLNSDMDKDIVVYLRGGEYKITDTIVFNEQDSGTNGYYITYRNYPGETPVLTGAQKIEGWQNVDGIFKTNVGSLKFRDFFVNGKRAIRSRTETHKIIKWDSTARKFYVDSSAVEGWDGINVSEVEAVLHTDWVESYTRMSSYTVDGSSVAIGLTSAGNNIFTRANPMRQVGQGVHFENSYKFLDQPGEWYLNESNGDLFYIPREGETLENINAVIPTIETFIRIQGSNKNNRVNNIRIQGITFEYTKYQSLIDNNGAIFNQGAFIGNTRQPAALYMKAADNIKIERNIFRNLGATGIDIDIMTRNNEIAGNALLDVAGNGIVEGAFRDLTGFSHTDSTTWARGNLFSNNYLRGIGTRYNGTGILVGYTNSTTIEHNEVSDVSYTAIGVGWGWTSNDTCQGNTKILNNNLYDYMNRLSDGGGIYTLSKTPGSEISGNYMHDIDRHEVISTACVRGIYLDQETEGYDVHDNVFVRLIDKIGINVVREGANQIHDNESQDPEIIANAGLEPEYWDIVPETMEQSTNASWIAQKYGAVRISGEVSSELDSVVVKVLKNGNPVLVSDPVSSSETLNFKVNIDVEKDDVISFVAEKDGNALEENVSWNLLIKPEVYPRLLIIEGIDFEGQSEEPAVISDVTSTVIAYAAGGTNLSNLDVSLQTPPGTYTVPDISTITDFSKPVKIRIYREDADEYDLEFPNGEKYREWEVSIKKEESGANVRGYNLGDVIADADNWYMSKGTKTAGVGSLRFAEGGYSIYTGRKFENELMEFNMKTDTTSAWQSIVFRTENTNDPIGNNNSCYITVIKKNEIELQRFNRGQRTVFYGVIGENPGIYGPGIPNTYFEDNVDNLIQVGALNTDEGVRLVMYINGQKVFDCIDTQENKLTAPGYFGTYQQVRPMTISRTPVVINMEEYIEDKDNWYMSKGTKTAGVGSLRFAEGGYSIYTGRKFENEMMEFNMKTDTTSAWQSIVFRTENTNDPIGNNNSCYITVIKKNEIELQRFNRGQRTVFYGVIGENPGIYGPGIPNTYFEDNVDNLIQVGALNTDEGVRLVMYINGQKVFDCVDTQENKLTAPGYFGTYQQVRPMTISRTSKVINMEEYIEDKDNWYMSKGTKTAGVGSLRFAEGGYSIYTGREFENEMMEFNMKTDTTSAWQSIVFRTENTNDPIGNNNSCYITVIKKNEIELQRFNRGQRTVFYGVIGENPGIYGPGIPNTYFEDNVDNLIQVGALNTDEGVRLVMYINGQKVFDCVDTQENRLTEPGYFGTYQQVRPMTISRTFITADRESAEEDTTAPTWPAGSKVEAIEVGQTDLTLIWTAAEDDTAVTGYNIYMGEELLDSVAADVYTYDVTGLTAGTEYTFTVQAVDAAGNESVDGPSVTVTTTAEETLIIQNPVFKDALGQELEHLIPSIDLRASVTIVNNGSKKANACFIIALYGPEKTFEKLAYIQGTIDAGETITLNGGFTLPDDVTGHFVKVFVWDSFEGMQPLSKAVIFE